MSNRHCAHNQLAVFAEFDEDGSGTIDQDELRAVLIKLGVQLDSKKLETVFRYFDKDGLTFDPTRNANAKGNTDPNLNAYPNPNPNLDRDPDTNPWAAHGWMRIPSYALLHH